MTQRDRGHGRRREENWIGGDEEAGRSQEYAVVDMNAGDGELEWA